MLVRFILSNLTVVLSFSQLYAKQCNVPSTPSTSSSPASRKRARDEDAGDGDCRMEGAGNESGAGVGSSGPAARPAPNSADRTAPGPAGTAPGQLPDLNFPLPGEQGPACLVKVQSCL